MIAYIKNNITKQTWILNIVIYMWKFAVIVEKKKVSIV